MLKTYSSADVAAALGLSADGFYRARPYLHAQGMPQPVLPRRPFRFEASGFDAWLTRHHPLRPQQPANDIAPPLAPATIADHQAALHDYYRRKGIPAG